MNDQIKEDILSIIEQAVVILGEKEQIDASQLEELSNHTIHDASIYQDFDAVSVAILIYALYKVCKELGSKDYARISDELEDARNHLWRNKLAAYNKSIQRLFSRITNISKKTSMFITEVLDAAKIKKGAQLFKHGISAARAAEILGITQWELLGYLGTTQLPESVEIAVPTRKRLELAFALFGGAS